MGVTFDRSQTEQATAARVADTKAERAEQALMALQEARRQLARPRQPYRKTEAVGGREPTVLETVLPLPDAAATLALIRRWALLVDKHARLTEAGADPLDFSAVDRWLNAMAGGELPGDQS